MSFKAVVLNHQVRAGHPEITTAMKTLPLLVGVFMYFIVQCLYFIVL